MRRNAAGRWLDAFKGEAQSAKIKDQSNKWQYPSRTNSIECVTDLDLQSKTIILGALLISF